MSRDPPIGSRLWRWQKLPHQRECGPSSRFPGHSAPLSSELAWPGYHSNINYLIPFLRYAPRHEKSSLWPAFV